ncbi:hypothetical protein [Komagataeibacter sp. FNDCR2]|nr:hypothetical protein [Komagataeibacter sp. FNDCR2]MCE2576538.1 hypothetical protein [Komagataeibacter sp. FNDCR2]
MTHFPMAGLLLELRRQQERRHFLLMAVFWGYLGFFGIFFILGDIF